MLKNETDPSEFPPVTWTSILNKSELYTKSEVDTKFNGPISVI